MLVMLLVLVLMLVVFVSTELEIETKSPLVLFSNVSWRMHLFLKGQCRHWDRFRCRLAFGWPWFDYGIK